jgi:uncharacterized protein YdeI (BOF family)
MMLASQCWKIAVVGALLGMTGTLFAAREPTASVREVLARQGSPAVSVEGRVQVQQPNRFILRDRTGAIRLETCPVWYRFLSLRPGERVRVQGELTPRLRWRRNQPVFLVNRLRREDGTEIPLRFDAGPPPWQRETWRAEVSSQ